MISSIAGAGAAPVDVGRGRRFLGSLLVRMEENGTWTLAEPLRFYSDITQREYLVPVGFNTDFASVPRLPLVYWTTGNTAHKAAVVHDFLYRTGAEARTVCDAIFDEAMEVSGTPAWRRKVMWLGVRLFGRRHHVATAARPETVPAPGASAASVSD